MLLFLRWMFNHQIQLPRQNTLRSIAGCTLTAGLCLAMGYASPGRAAPITTFSAPLSPRINFQHPLDNKDIALREVQAFLQDSQGFMWIGGGGGLVRYDGYEFKFILQTVSTSNGKEKIPVKMVNSIYEDKEHLLWILTRTGLLRYDPRTELLTAALENTKDVSVTMSTTAFYQATESPTGELIFTSTAGLFILDKKNNTYSEIRSDKTKKAWLSNNDIRSIHRDPSGTLWLGTSAGLEKFEWATKKFTLLKPYPENPELLEENSVTDIVSDRDETLWLGTKNGLVHFNPRTQQSTRYVNDPKDPNSIAGKEIAKLLVDSTGALWIASDGGGVALFEKTEQFPVGHFTNYLHEAGRTNSLSSNQVRTVYEDGNGDIWVGNYPAGINYFDRSSAAIITYANELSNINSLSHSSILAVREDAMHNLWLGTDGGGLNFFDRQKNKFIAFKHNPNNKKTLSGNAVLDVFIADDGKIWAGTWGGGISVLDPATGEFYRMPFDTMHATTQSITSASRLNSNTVWTIKTDRQKNLWIGTHAGLSKFVSKTATYTHYVNTPEDLTSISYGTVWNTFEDSKGNFWVGTATGLDIMNRDTGTFAHFNVDPKKANSLSNPFVLSFFEDAKNRLWIGTDEGLNLLNPDGKTFTVFNKSTGFNDDSIRTIVGDIDGRLWLATNNGITVFDPDTQEIKNYNRDSGHLMGGFHIDSALRSSKGEIIVGGIEGLRIVDPQKLKNNTVVPPIMFTSFKIFTDTVNIGDANHILPQSLNHTQNIVLDHKAAMFQLGFSALNFRDAGKNSYAYQLEGFDENWRYVSGQHAAVYTNLNAGTYIFHVKGSNNDGVWNEKGTSIKITVLPSIWRSWIAYILYALALAIVLTDIVRTQRKKLNDAQHKIAQERALNERMKNLDALKENFLANTSHELRTPLNGIIGLAESIKTGFREMSLADIEQKASMIFYSGKRLANIVNDILEFSQLANNELTLSLSEIHLRPVIAKVLADLHDRLGDKGLIIVCNLADDITVLSNEYRLGQIVHHIIDNAIKFTREGSITITHQQDPVFDRISVSDTGIGIAPENISTIFCAFQQVDGSAKRTTEGAGLGLSVIQKLVELHKGTMAVESVVGKGTTFHIWLPRPTANSATTTTTAITAGANVNENNNNNNNKNAITASTSKNGEATQRDLLAKTHNVYTLNFNSHLYADESSVPQSVSPDKKYKILVVDDDPINRMVVKAHLHKENFDTAEAIDGEDALKVIAEQNDIDLIVLDIMMPRMTGHEVCEALRLNFSLHKLPIIFLTANQQPSEAIKAFSVGGSDFMTKPISGKLLVHKIKTHLSLLEESRKIDRRVNANNTKVAIRTDHYLDLPQAIANIIEHAFCLITPIEKIGCWMLNDNVFVTDGACMTSASCVNPSLTYMALTARAADFAVKELKKGNL